MAVCVTGKIVKYGDIDKIEDARSLGERFLHKPAVAKVTLPPGNNKRKFYNPEQKQQEIGGNFIDQQFELYQNTHSVLPLR